jgi:hypothetical protein
MGGGEPVVSPVRLKKSRKKSYCRYIVAMSFYALAHFANLFFSGILAGIEIGIHYGIGAPPQGVSERDEILLRQSMVLNLRVLIPVFFVLTAISAVGVTVIDGRSSGYLFRYAGMLTLVLWIVTRAIGTVPINRASLTWNAAAPPADWRSRVKRAEMFHICGSWAAVALFALFLADATFKQPH